MGRDEKNYPRAPALFPDLLLRKYLLQVTEENLETLRNADVFKPFNFVIDSSQAQFYDGFRLCSVNCSMAFE